jgi:hypothetical protein
MTTTETSARRKTREVPAFLKSLFESLGIELGSATANTDDPIEIPLPKELLWIDQLVNHSWENHEDQFESKEQLKGVVVDTVQNAKGGCEAQAKDSLRIGMIKTDRW